MRRVLLAACLGLPLLATGAERWLPLQDVSLMVEAGSILDLSALAPAQPVRARLIVNPAGHFALADRPQQAVRFLMASTGFDSATGGFPDKLTTDLYVQQLKRHGYNMARLHFVDATLMTERDGDFNFNPVQLDRLHYLLAALGKAGIYYLMDGLSSSNGGYGGIRDQWINQRQLKRRVYYDPEAQAHWKKLVDIVLGGVNPYTGQATLADPALAGIILVNEGGLEFLSIKGVPAALQPLYAEWRKQHGRGGGADFPKLESWGDARMGDTQRFFVDLQRRTAEWMTQHLRKAGYQGLVTAYDNWNSPAADVARAQFEWVDMHNYHAEPSNFVAPGSVMPQESMLAGGAKYLTALAAARHYGKAYTVSEYGQVFWNKFRRESSLAIPAYAALQQWDMISQHSGALILSYGERGGRKDRIFPFMVGPDPVARAGETLAALLFLRGDVAPALQRFGLRLEPAFAFDISPMLGTLPSDLRRVALLGSIGLDWEGGQARDYEVQLSPSNLTVKLRNGAVLPSAPSLVERAGALAQQYAGGLGAKFGNTQAVSQQRFATRLDTLRRGGILGPRNRSTADGVYHSDTEQLLLDSGRKRLSVITARTEAVVFDQPEPITLQQLRVEQSDGPALVAASAMDGQPLAASARVLLILATDARNTGMRFSDAGETMLLDLGTKPVQLLARRLRLRLDSSQAEKLAVYALNLRGQRGEAIAVQRDAVGISFELDTASLHQGPTTYFEIISKD